VCAVEIPRADPGHWDPQCGVVSGITDGAGRCAADGGAGALSRRGVAYRSAQDWSARVFGRRAYGGGDEHAF
jgi:hypothetical protein